MKTDEPIKLMILMRKEDGLFQCGYRMPGEPIQAFEGVFPTFEAAHAKLKELGAELERRFGTRIRRSTEFNN